MQIIRRIKLDFARESHTVKIFAKQGDINSRYVEIEPLENGLRYQIPDGVIARFAAKKPDGTEIFNDYPTISENIITVVLTEQTLAADGDVECDIQIYQEESGQVLKAQTFVIRVRPDVLKNAKSSSEYQSYEAALLKIEKSKLQAVEAVEAAKNALAEAEAALAKVDEAQVAYDQMMNDFGDLGGIAVSEEKPTNPRIHAYINPNRGNPISVMEPKDLINKNNLLQNPLFDGKDGWISTGEIVEAGDFANGIELVNEGSGVSAIQRIEYSKVKGMLGDGETAKMYHISYKTNDASKPCKVYVQAVGSGTKKMLFPLTTVNFSTKFEIDFSAIESELPSVHTIIIGFSFGWSGYSVVISEPFFGVYDDEYNGFWNKIFGDKVARKDFDVIATNVNPLYGKKISVNGDSICYGKGYTGGYGKIIAEKNGMTLQNIGVSGATIAAERYFTGSDGNPDTTKPRHWICRTIENMDSDADYAIIEGGVNDASQSDSVLGNISQSYTETFDDTTFCGAFESMLKKLIVRFAGKKYGYIAVHKMAPNYRSENEENTSYYWAAKKCCEKWGVPFLDLNISVPPFNYLRTADESLATLATTYTDAGDGWHPNEEGYRKYYVPKIEAWLKTL